MSTVPYTLRKQVAQLPPETLAKLLMTLAETHPNVEEALILVARKQPRNERYAMYRTVAGKISNLLLECLPVFMARP
jgi:hypothetical protein